ncbi:hypothetical protein Vretimale_18132 [Volvox reticuliferus]|uniref:Uncharacterized protein n=1 Tax=Volvox reticuliferus TaxID=1737510 RepID=A0A8J4GXN5_9CHLO|nr:hypothetical protein Vretifemale_17785 [Volvox reticuliferus]GIM15270.1 hypothetical protein Vretimale_18132 [Volvox reticuliferus]
MRLAWEEVEVEVEVKGEKLEWFRRGEHVAEERGGGEVEEAESLATPTVAADACRMPGFIGGGGGGGGGGETVDGYVAVPSVTTSTTTSARSPFLRCFKNPSEKSAPYSFSRASSAAPGPCGLYCQEQILIGWRWGL